MFALVCDIYFVYMEELEQKLKNVPVKPLLYLRYKDNIFCICD